MILKNVPMHRVNCVTYDGSGMSDDLANQRRYHPVRYHWVSCSSQWSPDANQPMQLDDQRLPH